MRVVFIGVVSIGWHCLKALLDSGANVVGIFTADKEKMIEKSGMHPDYFSKFEDLAQQWGVPLSKVDTVSVPLDIEMMKGLKPDLIFCIGWPQIVGKEVLGMPPSGCIGIHPTLLPERRGGAPINWCLIDGLSKSGVTLFYFDEGIDSGDIIAQQEFELTLEDTAETVLNKVSRIATQLVRAYYPLLEKGKAPRLPQDHSKATYTRRRRPEDGVIEWRRTSVSIYNWVRALTLPFPGAFTFWEDKKVTIWESKLFEGYRVRFGAHPGEILDSLEGKGIVVATGDYCILIERVECDDEAMRGNEFTDRFKITPGSILGGINTMAKILVIAPHPDDEVLGCGGTIAKHASGRDEVYLCIVTKAYPPEWSEDEILRRKEEVLRVNEILGIKKTHFLDLPTAKLDTIPRKELSDSIARVVNEVKTDVIYIPHRGDVHEDHRQVFDAAMVAARPRPGSTIGKMLCYEILSETEWAAPFVENAFMPNVYADISQTLEIKLEAMSAYGTELKEFPHPRSLEAISALAKRRGSTIGVTAAEGFMLVREIQG